MINFFILMFIEIAQKKYPRWYRILCLILSIGLVFVFFPFFYWYTGNYIESVIKLPIPTVLANIIAIPFLLLGGTLIIWTFILQYTYGEGAGSHLVPTQKLIVFGPYKMSRHPMLLGAVFFYFGMETLVSSITTGLYSAIATAILAYLFVIYIEEPVLVARFGEQYKEYQKKVPLIPFLTCCLNHCNGKHKA